MKILQVCLTYGSHFGGIYEHVRNISERLARAHEVMVFATDPMGNMPREEVINGVRIERFKSWAPNCAFFLSEGLRKRLKKCSSQYDVVHAHGYHAFPALYAAQTRKKHGFVFTPHYHGGGHTFLRNLLHVPYKYLGKRIFEKADSVICVSNYERNLILKNFDICPEKMILIPNGIDPEEFQGLRRNRDKQHRIILFVGRLEKYKGVDHLIKVLPRLSEDVYLEIIGKGPYESKLARLTNRVGVAHRVRFHRGLPRKELLQKYVEADLFALLSEKEAYSIVVSEALAARTPCVLANSSALTERIDNENCFGIDSPINIAQLANLISRALGKRLDPIQLPTWDDTVRRLVNVYEVFLSG